MRTVLSILLLAMAFGLHAQPGPQEPGTVQSAEDPKVKELVNQALELRRQAAGWQPTDRVEELERRRENLRQQVDLYLKILALSSAQPFALANQPNAERDLAAVEERLGGMRDSKSTGEKALSDAYGAMQHGNFAAAAAALAIARRALGSDPRVNVAERNLDRLQTGRNVLTYGSGTLLACALGWCLKLWRGKSGRKF